MSQILGVNDPYVIPGTMGGGGSSLPEDSAGYLYNDGSGNLSYDEAPTPEPAGSDTQIQFNDGGVMAGSSALTFDKTKKTLSLTNAITDFSSSALYGRCCDQQATALASSYQAPIASLGSSSKSIRILDGNQQSFASITGDSISIYDYCNFENKKAQGYISGSTSNVAAGQTVTIGSTVYTFATTPTVEGDVAVGANVTASLQNLYAAINGTGTLGVEHYCTSAHPDVTASAFNSAQKRILLEAKTAGAAGESITLAESSALSKSGSTLVRPADWLATYLLRLSMDSDGSYGTQVKHGNVTGINAVLAMSGFNGTMYCNPVGYSVQISSAVTDALAYDRGTMIFFQGSADIFGGHYTDIFGFKAETISVSSYGSADNAYCFYAATPAVNTSSGAFVTNAYGLYVEDFTSSGATNVYGLYIAGATQNNYIAGNLEVAGTLIATVPDPVIGTDTQVIFNDTGALVGSAEFTYTKTSAILGLTRTVDDADGPQMVFTQSRGVSASANDSIGLISFKGYDETCTLTEFARIQSYILDATDGTEDGKLSFQIMCQGVWREAMRIERNTNNFYGVLIGDAASPLAALHVESTSLDFAYAVKVINTWANRGAIDAQGSDVDGIGIRTQGGTGIQTIGRKNGGAAIVAEVDTNYDGYSVRAIRNSSVTTGYPVIAAWCADTIGSGQTILEIMSDCYNLGRTPAGYFITAKNYTTEVFSFDYTGTFKTTGRIHIDNVPNDDTSVTGIITTATAGEALAFGDICYLGADGLYYKSDADASTTMPAVVMATGTIAASASGKFLEFGYARNDAWDWTPGGLIYADTTTAGGMTQTAPTGSGDQVQIVGYAYSADVVKFMPQLVIVEV